MTAIGMDIGGRSMRVAAVDLTGMVIARRSEAMTDADDPEHLVGRLADAVADIRDALPSDHDASTPIGLALPGILDPGCGTLIRSVNLPLLEGYAIRDTLAHRTGCPVELVTDAEAATWGEYLAREPRPNRFVHLRLGTGVALGAVVAGELERLDSARREHLEVLVVDRRPEAPLCTCGRRGCLETIASGRSLDAQVTRSGFGGGLDVVQRAFRAGDAAARQLVQSAANALAIAIQQVAGRFEVDSVCLGGGVITHLPALASITTDLLGSFDHSTAPTGPRPIAIDPARLGDDAGVIGSALIAMA